MAIVNANSTTKMHIKLIAKMRRQTQFRLNPPYIPNKDTNVVMIPNTKEMIEIVVESPA